MTQKVAGIVVFALIGIALGGFGTAFYLAYPSMQGPTIDDSWLLVCNRETSKPWDETVCTWIQDKYGGDIVDVNYPVDFDKFGQSIVFVGGSRTLSKKLPWAETGFPPLQVAKPTTYPDVYWNVTGDFRTAYLHTPNKNYMANDEGTLIENYGYIAKGYDYLKRRWIIVIIGWSAEATAYGGKLLCTEWGKVVESKYLVYACTSPAINTFDPAIQKTMDSFDGDIVEVGK